MSLSVRMVRWGIPSWSRHKIDTGGTRPIKLPVRRMGPDQRDILNKEMDKIIAKRWEARVRGPVLSC